MAKPRTIIFILSTLISVILASPKVKSAYLTYNEETKEFKLHQNEELSCSTPWVVKGSFSNEINETGWSYLTITSSSDFPDNIQAYFAGYLEASLTRDLISQNWINNVEGYCSEPYNPYCQRLHEFLQENMDWMNQQIQAKAASDPYWHMVELFLHQVNGITDGYFNVTPQAGSTNLDPFGFYAFQISGDLEDLESALGKEDLKSHVLGSGSCSALIKLLPGYQDLYVAHDTWAGFQTMLRILKKYDFAFHSTSQTKDFIPGQAMTFSSYPGTIYSGDDYYLISSGLASLETTIGNSNDDLWQYIKPTGGVMEGIRTMVANRLAKTGDDWAKIFSQFNSGTYNNQWMIVDYTKFKPGMVPSSGLLTILEQIPGFVMHMDTTELLVNQTYWPSYNIPFCKKIFNMSGQQENVAKYGDWFTYDKSPRAQIFRRDHVKVMDLESMTRLMRYNNFKQDPLSKCDCSPPYSGENAISARSDLNPADGTYPFGALGHRLHGGTDMKITNSAMFKELTFKAISGPTWDDLPPFQWSTSDFKDFPHLGLPDLYKFEPIYFNGTALDKDMNVL